VADDDNIWPQILAGSLGSEASAGYRELADFVALKATNDEIRQRAVEWLVDLFSGLAGQLNRRSIAIELERKEQHSFPAIGANMVGLKTTFRHGVRCLTVEAGWTRSPSDGFMRGGALAVAQLRHFGLKRHSADLALLKTGDRPEWHFVDNDRVARPINVPELAKHMAILSDLDV
jgi:hypothetical protein